MMAAPSVYPAINAVSADLAESGITKTHTNAVDGYKYRSIDDVLDALAPLLARHRLCILPRVLAREVIERGDEMDRLLFHVALKVAFDLTSVDDGSQHTVESFGEALDPSDKATAKAMSAAYKSAMVQTFCIPCAGCEADNTSYRASARSHPPSPVQGWEQWVADIEDVLNTCESGQAVALVQEHNRNLLTALNSENAALYQRLGRTFLSRREALQKKPETNERKRLNRATKVLSRSEGVPHA